MKLRAGMRAKKWLCREKKKTGGRETEKKDIWQVSVDGKEEFKPKNKT